MIPKNASEDDQAGNQRLILASKSPRRRDLLHQAGFVVEIDAPRINEHEIFQSFLASGHHAFEATEALAVAKARSTFEKHKDEAGVIIIAADTIVYLDGQVFSKPKDDREALHMLKSLSGRTHQVTTAFAIMSQAGEYSERHTTDVRFNEWDTFQETVAKRYISLGLAKDKAGAYGIQDFTALLIRDISGDYNTVVGLPLTAVSRALAEFGLTLT